MVFASKFYVDTVPCEKLPFFLKASGHGADRKQKQSLRSSTISIRSSETQQISENQERMRDPYIGAAALIQTEG